MSSRCKGVLSCKSIFIKATHNIVDFIFNLFKVGHQGRDISTFEELLKILGETLNYRLQE